ncbi:glutamine synthetase III [Eggerthia catenaformis]|uniref:glutamine synthetase III family protein n=1 Tax=Eggerthia catenaformis TaxID=31973 RepID=UPI00047BC407|nr:glutamine synthetase III [Eggerthia catenaformis]
MEMDDLLKEYGCLTFSDDVMKERIPKSAYKAFHESLDKGEPLTKECATVVANAMKIWAIKNGATHFTHWFTPLTGLTAEKHDAFLEPSDGGAVLEFSGKTLRKGEPDASSFPSGGIRSTFEARGYTSWDCTSSAFVRNGSLYIPTLFCSYTGDALDEKTPLLRSCDALEKSALRLLPKLGLDDVKHVKATVGAEQEYFLVPDEYYQKRMDLKLTGRTLYGAMAPKGQELGDHYFGSLKRKVNAFMTDLDHELWKYGIPSKTKHNEVAPAQHEVACVYSIVNITADNNHLLMQLAQDIAKKHGLRCLLHEKPFAGVNGSGKHNNWSVSTDTGINLMNPGKDPLSNIPFLAQLACTIKGIDEYADLLRLTAASAGNDHRLGADEAPPAIISIFLGEELDDVISNIINNSHNSHLPGERFKTGVSVIPTFSKDTTDRNRTSPFAFTGNKFEFRAVGSAQSISNANTMLNTIFAQEMEEMSDLIDSGMSIMDIIKKFISEHQRIIFNGDGYSQQWEEEAAKRGLPNYKNTVDAAKALRIEKNISLLEHQNIYSKVEIESRYEIILDNYIKTISVEAGTAYKMAKSEIYPAVLRYIGQVTEDAKGLAALNLDNEFILRDLVDLSEHASTMRAQMEDLYQELTYAKSFDESEIEKASLAYRDRVIPAMKALRKTADHLETIVAKGDWPMPDYIDLMFGL